MSFDFDAGKYAIYLWPAFAVSAVAFLSSVVSFNNAIIMIKIYQMMDFMLLYNVDSPPRFLSFISIFIFGGA